MPDTDKHIVVIDADISKLRQKLAHAKQEIRAFAKESGRVTGKGAAARHDSFSGSKVQESGMGAALKEAIKRGGKLVLSAAEREKLIAFVLRVFEEALIETASDLISELIRKSNEKGKEPQSIKQAANEQADKLLREKGQGDLIEGENTRKILGGIDEILAVLLERLRQFERQFREAENAGEKNLSVEAGEELAFPTGEELASLQGSIDLLREKIVELENVRLILERALDEPARNQALIDQFSELSDCLQRLCDRLDELGLQGSGGSADLTGGAGNDTLSGGAGRGGRLIPASFGNTGLDELNRKLTESAWRVQDLSTGFQEAGDAAEDYGSETRTLNGLIDRSNLQFTKQTGLIGALRQQLPELGVDFVKVFDETTEQGRELNSVIGELGTSLSDAFSEGVFKGKELSGVLKGLAEDILRILGNAAQSGGLGGSGGGGSFLSSLFGSPFVAITRVSGSMSSE